MSKLKEQLRNSVKREIKNANNLMNAGQLEDAQVILKKIAQYFPNMNNHCREAYKKALNRSGLEDLV